MKTSRLVAVAAIVFSTFALGEDVPKQTMIYGSHPLMPDPTTVVGKTEKADFNWTNVKFHLELGEQIRISDDLVVPDQKWLTKKESNGYTIKLKTQRLSQDAIQVDFELLGNGKEVPWKTQIKTKWGLSTTVGTQPKDGWDTVSVTLTPVRG